MGEAKKSITRNYIYNATFKVLVVLTPLITAPYLARVLGVDLIGDFSYTSSIVAIFVMFATLGSYIYGSREISYVQQDRKAVSKLFWEVEILSLVSVLLVGICYGIFVALQTNYLMLYIVQCISLISVATNISWLFQGMEEFKRISEINILFRLLNLAYIFVFVRSQSDFIIYVLGHVGLECMGNLAIWVYLPKYVDHVPLKELHPFSHLKGTLLLFVPTVATTVYTIFDKTMIGLFTDTKVENGYYEQAMKLPKTALTLITAMEAVMIPRVGSLFVDKKEKELKELLYRIYEFVWFLSIALCMGLFSVADHFIPWFYGPGYEKSALLLKILCFTIPLIGLSNVTGVQYLMATKRENKVTQTVFTGAIINLVLNLFLIPRIYSVGAAIASVFAELIITAMQLFLVRKELSIGRIFACSLRYVLAGAAMTIALYFLGRLFEPGAIGSLVLIVSGAIVYLLIALHGRKNVLRSMKM